MRSLPDQKDSENQIGIIDASYIWESVVLSMNQYTNDSATPKFLPPEEILSVIRPVAAAFAQLHFTPLPALKDVYKSQLYGLFYLSIICGMQMYLKERAMVRYHAPYSFHTDKAALREAKHEVMKQLTEGIKVFPPINKTMDIFLAHMLTPRRIAKLPIKNAEFDNQKFHKFMPVILLWGYLFARAVITDK